MGGTFSSRRNDDVCCSWCYEISSTAQHEETHGRRPPPFNDVSLSRQDSFTRPAPSHTGRPMKTPPIAPEFGPSVVMINQTNAPLSQFASLPTADASNNSNITPVQPQYFNIATPETTGQLAQQQQQQQQQPSVLRYLKNICARIYDLIEQNKN